MAKVQPRTLSGFMELLPARQIQFDRMAAIIVKYYKVKQMWQFNHICLFYAIGLH